MIIYKVYVSIPSEKVKFELKSLLPDEGSYLEYDSASDRFYGLYGWTNDENIMSEFKDQRKDCKYYRYIQTKISSDEYEIYKNQYKLWRIKLHKLRVDIDGIKSVRVPTTLFEKSISEDDDSIYPFLLDSGKYFIVDYFPFNDEIIDALDILNYTTEYDAYIGGDPQAFDEHECDERIELALYNMGYGLTVNNNKYFNIFHNKLNIFMLIYKDFLYGG